MLSEDTIRRAKENRTGRCTRTWDEYEDVLDTCLALFTENARLSEALAACNCQRPVLMKGTSALSGPIVDCGKCPPCKARARKEASHAIAAGSRPTG